MLDLRNWKKLIVAMKLHVIRRIQTHIVSILPKKKTGEMVRVLKIAHNSVLGKLFATAISDRLTSQTVLHHGEADVFK